MGLVSSKPTFRVLLLGLDAAGKTTLLKGLTGREIEEGPTTSHNIGQLKLKGAEALMFDLGGQQRLITFWRQYYEGTGIILFIIDSSDTQRISNAKEELYRLIHEDQLIGIPLLIIANKQDMEGALTPEQIADELELGYLVPRQVSVIGTCAKTMQNFDKVKAWIHDHAIYIQDLPQHLINYNKQLAQIREEQKKLLAYDTESQKSKHDHSSTHADINTSQSASELVPQANQPSTTNTPQATTVTADHCSTDEPSLTQSTQSCRAPRLTVTVRDIQNNQQQDFIRRHPTHDQIDNNDISQITLEPGDTIVETPILPRGSVAGHFNTPHFPTSPDCEGHPSSAPSPTNRSINNSTSRRRASNHHL